MVLLAFLQYIASSVLLLPIWVCSSLSSLISIFFIASSVIFKRLSELSFFRYSPPPPPTPLFSSSNKFASSHTFHSSWSAPKILHFIEQRTRHEWREICKLGRYFLLVFLRNLYVVHLYILVYCILITHERTCYFCTNLIEKITLETWRKRNVNNYSCLQHERQLWQRRQQFK